MIALDVTQGGLRVLAAAIGIEQPIPRDARHGSPQLGGESALVKFWTDNVHEATGKIPVSREAYTGLRFLGVVAPGAAGLVDAAEDDLDVGFGDLENAENDGRTAAVDEGANVDPAKNRGVTRGRGGHGQTISDGSRDGRLHLLGKPSAGRRESP